VLALDTNVRGVVVYRPIGLMPRKQDCRKRLVHTALRLFASRGYHDTSIADVLRESGCKRGTLYYHFPSKEELGYAAIDEALRQLVEEGAASHFQTNEHPIDRLVKVIDSLPSLTKLGAKGASASDVAIQMAAVHDGFRKRLARSLAALTQQVEEMVCRGVAEGQIANSVDPVHLAHMVATMGAGMQLGSLLWDREVIREDAKRWLTEYLNSLRA
jgi:TetR/AcrR family transcriptional repressor of nem operon